MSSRFPSFVLKSKRSNQAESGGTAKSSSNSTTSAPPNNYFMSSTANSSKGRINKPPPDFKGLQITPTKTLLKASRPTISKKSSSTLPVSKHSSSLQWSTSDDLSKALVLKKKNCTRISTPSIVTKKSSKSTKKGANNVANNVAKAEDVVENKVVGYLDKAEENGKVEMHQEGPLEILEGNFDFYSILARPKVWGVEEDEDDTTTVNGSGTNEIPIKNPVLTTSAVCHAETYPSNSCSLIKQKESEIWGSMRASTAEESSTPPSLTSIGENERKACAAEDLKKVSEEEMIRRDENNNVLESIRNTIYRSQPFLEASRSSTATTTISATAVVSERIEESEMKETVPEVDYDKGNRQASFSTSKELDQVSESEGKINVQPCHNSNIHNSQTPPGISLCGSSPDSSLIRLEIGEQFEEALGVNSTSASSVESQQEHCTRQLQNHFSLQTKLEQGEVVELAEPVSEENPPPLTKSESGSNIKNSSLPPPPSSLSELVVLNGSKTEHSVVDETGTNHSCDYEKSSTKQISPTSSFLSAAAADEEFFHADMVENFEEFDSQQTQTQRINSHDAETGTDSNKAREKKEKLMSLVMAVNTGVDITPSSEQPKKSVRMRGIMKPCRTESVNIEGITPIFSTSLSLPKSGNGRARRRVTSEKIKYPQTFSQVWADYGFPPDISISGMIENIVTMTWASTNRDAARFKGKVSENNRANNDTLCTDGDSGEGCRLIEAAYDIVNAGLKFASDLIGIEADLEPREDWVRYNGYKIRVCGKKLLLESLHVNCDFSIDSNGICCRSNHSVTTLRPPSASRSELEKSCEGSRVRIVVRLAGPFAQDEFEQDEEETFLTLATNHTVRHTDGKWTFICGNEGIGDNFVEIECPTGVYPKSLGYIVFNGRLLVDGP